MLGPPGNRGATVIAPGTRQHLEEMFQEVTLSVAINNDLAIPPENHLKIYVRRKPLLLFERM